MRRRFTIDGELINQQVHRGDNLEDHSVNDITFPSTSFEKLFTIPLEFVLNYITDKQEASTLIQVSRVGAKLDILLKMIVEELLLQEILHRAWSSCMATDSRLFAIVPLIVQIGRINGTKLQKLRCKVGECMKHLEELKRQLLTFRQINLSVVKALKRVVKSTAVAEATSRNTCVAQLEELLVDRIEATLRGDISDAFNVYSWEPLISSMNLNVEAQTTVQDSNAPSRADDTHAGNTNAQMISHEQKGAPLRQSSPRHTKDHVTDEPHTSAKPSQYFEDDVDPILQTDRENKSKKSGNIQHESSSEDSEAGFGDEILSADTERSDSPVPTPTKASPIDTWPSTGNTKTNEKSRDKKLHSQTDFFPFTQ